MPSRDEVLQVVNRHKWYQSIPLPHGLVTPGFRDSAKVWERLKLSDDQFAGKSVIDVGCNSGFFCFEAKKRGAARVLGIDIDNAFLRAASDVRDLLSLDVELRQSSVMALSPEATGVFDVTFCIRVFRHLPYPFHALQKIAAVTRECLVMIMDLMPSVGSHSLLYLLPKSAKVSPDEKDARYNKSCGVCPSAAAARHMLEGCGFRKVELESEVAGNRILIPRRLRPRRTVVKAWK